MNKKLNRNKTKINKMKSELKMLTSYQFEVKANINFVDLRKTQKEHCASE